MISDMMSSGTYKITSFCRTHVDLTGTKTVFTNVEFLHLFRALCDGQDLIFHNTLENAIWYRVGICLS